MNAALMIHSWRVMASSPLRILLVLALVLLPLGIQALSVSSEVKSPSILMLGVALLSGTCSGDMRSGLLRCILARPVERWRFLLSRWLAGVLALVGIATAGTLMSAVLAAIVAGEPATPLRVLRLVATSATLSLSVAAWFVAASVLLPGAVDALLLLVGRVGTVAAAELMTTGREPVLVVMRVLGALVIPPSPPSDRLAEAALVGSSSAAALLGVGLLILNRRQLPQEART